MKYLLYGANGYTAQLIIRESLKLGLEPILAGRNKEKIEQVAKAFKLPYKIFGLDDQSIVESELKNVSLCLNAAGPFSKTALPIINACLTSKTHYIDITGEIEVFEWAKSFDKQAKSAGIMLMPGTGFDVVPSDCLANYLKEKMPDANSLELAFTSVGGGLSHGTASTMLESLGNKSLIRKDGKMVEVDLAHKSKRIDFGSFSRTMGTIPWGDISTAYTSTGIPNIEVYTSIPSAAIKVLKFQSLFNPILKTNIVKGLGQKWVDKNLYGPSENANKNGRSYLHGVVKNNKGSKTAILKCAEGYLLTALGSVNISKKILEGNFVAGYQTPAMAYGWKIIMEIEGSEITDRS